MLEPLPLDYDDFLDDRVFTELGLPKTRYYSAFKEVKYQWMEKLGDLGERCIMKAAAHLNTILTTPEDWVEVAGRYLAEQTAKTHGDGSYQFIAETVPASIDTRIVRDKKGLREAVDILVDEEFVRRFEGKIKRGHLYSHIANQMRNGVITSIESLREYTSPHLPIAKRVWNITLGLIFPYQRFYIK